MSMHSASGCLEVCRMQISRECSCTYRSEILPTEAVTVFQTHVLSVLYVCSYCLRRVRIMGLRRVGEEAEIFFFIILFFLMVSLLISLPDCLRQPFIYPQLSFPTSIYKETCWVRNYVLPIIKYTISELPALQGHLDFSYNTPAFFSVYNAFHLCANVFVLRSLTETHLGR